ncbi:hypothetical protein RHOFW510R12_01370 [Rhodanobacter sp. FW510-R12]|uniref:hypothetical protein n=1 Tax=unclassified Rhodanobacter TaxID=2621553 RepID=UPI0007AA4E2D|nr:MULTISPECIES: hypothetical protein [unclassified Rhodanobacter]KZC17046.1 hypothetical protein RHOFW104R8_13475 [Rhodanobacter sp. FW104-R8]KZC28570.1 hypothetical protein RhoFW510T8_10715 [Rhodanobacter sp. FW510-T8]KZC32328.1 hypothetical protein RhoFW510R10_12915 [Rhodanobacter sp. FW510-R10]
MNTTAWLISFTGSDGVKVQKVHTHNCIADFRTIDPNATAQAIDCAAVAELIEAAERAVEAFEELGKARGVASNHFARRECEAAMVAQKAALANVRSAS